MNAFDRFLLALAPRWSLNRMRARGAALALQRTYDAASTGRRTSGWRRQFGDANVVTARALVELRAHARDLVRNNGWARRAQRVIANNTAGWGIQAKAVGPDAKQAAALWAQWAGTTECDAEGRRTFAGIQHLVMRSVAEAGEVLIRRRVRRPADGLSIPLQLQVLEADYLDISKDGIDGVRGPIVQGVEFDLLGRRAAYWLFPAHPGGNFASGESRRVDASEVIHVAYSERPEQVRGVSWFGAGIVPLKDLDDFEDAELMRQKIAACFAAFVEDADGAGTAIGEQDADDPLLETFEPGMILQLPPGKKVTTATPPAVVEGSFAARHLRKVAAGLGVPYEELTGDYSQVNFSSARMARLAHWANVHDWRWNMLVPLLCDGAWRWAMNAAVLDSGLPAVPQVSWTAPPMPMIEPDKEGLAYQRLVRGGTMTHDEMVREQGGDPETHWVEYAAGLKNLDALGIKLDSDVRAVSQAGQAQQAGGGGGGGAPAAEAEAGETDEDSD